jgi:NADH dehydrogenase
VIRRAVVTGAFSYTGSVIAQRLVDQGCEVVSLSRRAVAPAGHPLMGVVSAERLQFGDADALVRALTGAEVLFNTYWIRFGRHGATFEGAVENSRILFAAARRAGVARIVHVSVTNASATSPFAYFRGKAAVERVLAETTAEYAVIRPSLVFGGRQEILINNMAWLLRRLPVYAVPGDGRYSVQPVAVGDVAELALAASLRSGPSSEDAVGREVYRFDEFLTLLAGAVGTRARLVHLPEPAVVALGRALGLLLRDVMITREELGALTAGLLTSDAPPTGRTSFAEWLPAQSDWLGRRYANELRRNWLDVKP